MSANAYPSPLSATTLPQSDNESSLTGTTNLTTGSRPSDETETQVALHQASVALEAVYRRIRQFRRNLQEVADSASSGERHTRPSADNNLTGVREPSSSLIMQDNSYGSEPSQHPIVGPPRIRRLNRDLPPLTTFPPAHDISSSSNSPPPTAPYTHLHENWSQRNSEFHADDAETTLGRRVAAREATRASATHSRRNSNPLTRFEGNLIQLVVNMEREFDHIRQQRSEISRTLPPDARPAPLSRRTTELRRQLASQNRETSSPANFSLVPPSDWFRRRLAGLPSSRSPTMSSWSERLSLLSNFSSVQNLPTPVSTSSSRPLLFEEPTSYLQGSEDPNESRSVAFSNESGVEPDRSYVVRRRYTAEGEEHVHPISLLEWPDEPLTFAGQEPGILQREQPEVVPHRRRGWARLDSDGNEIPFEQEEELERARSEYRAQARTADPGVRLTTSTSLTPDDDADDDGRIPRVRLNNLARRQYDSDKENKELEKHGLASPMKPFRPCPLPTPLEDMDWTPPPCKPLCTNRVSKHASFAGR
ncbi:hypothetical protein C0992_006402 [Termitomyces sp. T32_za158]|nr:hypothetical protein C0992_006402 [Termitomyces sp. T32_za158]